MIANMRYVTGALAVLLSVALVWLVRYAAGEDTYYSSEVSRWEHADRWGKTPVVVAAMAIIGTTILGLLISTFSPSARLRLLALPAAALSCVMLVAAWFYLTAGH
jgi:hypothetical protein